GAAARPAPCAITYRAAAIRRSFLCRLRHRAGWASGDTLVARRGLWAQGASARRGTFRPDRHDRRSLQALWHRRRVDPLGGGTDLFGSATTVQSRLVPAKQFLLNATA